MAYDELKKALQGIDTDDFVSAVARVYVKQMRMEEARDMVTGFSSEYPALSAAAPVVGVHGEYDGYTPREYSIAATAFLASLVGLKEMIDTAALNDIPTAEG